ncbi:unnamed protein product [Protopolystoma xenopodis]|uniref:Uncharacterized protein n=1 Tax=Protopolystoma xenopodis TaxID=117903 RepID=A0A3S5A5X3_9PLAT|nr:unnamed protein product [Protopolystoma xenopodis]
MIPCSDAFRHMTDESSARVHRNRRRLPRKQCPHESSSKPIDNWSRGIRRRLLVEPTFECLHQTLSLEMEVSSTMAMVSRTAWGTNRLCPKHKRVNPVPSQILRM